MKTFAVTVEDGAIGEAVEFSNGHVVVRWLVSDTISRFSDLGSLRDVIQATATFEPIRSEPLAQRLRAARTKAGLSQRGLSRETGVSFSTISRIESGSGYTFNQALEDWIDAHA